MTKLTGILALALLAAQSAYSDEREDGIEYKCGASRCKVECVGPGNWIRQFARGTKVTVYSQSNGTTVFEVKGMHGSQTIFAAGEGYICSIRDHR